MNLHFDIFSIVAFTTTVVAKRCASKHVTHLCCPISLVGKVQSFVPRNSFFSS